MDYQEKVGVKHNVWQYVIDHATIQPNGYYGVSFFFKNKADFWRRVSCRAAGFKRYDEDDKEETIKHLKESGKIRRWHKYCKLQKHIKDIQSDGTFKQKIFYWIYKKIELYFMRLPDKTPTPSGTVTVSAN